MILADTSVWVEHLRRRNQRLAALLLDQAIVIHPFVIGELALGTGSTSTEWFVLLGELPQAPQASHQEALHFVKERALGGSGIGWIDAHLLCGAVLARARLWTLDRRLAAAAERLGIAG